MTPSSRDRISVDLRGSRAALIARAREQGVSPSDFVRSTLAAALGGARAEARAASGVRVGVEHRVRLSMRMQRRDIDALRRAARGAGLDLGNFVAVLVERLARADDPNPAAELAALTASCAELATLSRNLHQLTNLLRQGSVEAALQYRRMLDTIGTDVRAHLDLATAVVAQLRPLVRLATSSP